MSAAAAAGSLVLQLFKRVLHLLLLLLQAH